MKRALLLVSSFAVALALFECGARVLELAPQTKSLAIDEESSVYRRSDDPVLGFELARSYRSDDADGWTSYPSTDSHGFRDVEHAIAKAPGVRRTLLLGDSVVEGAGLVDVEETIGRRLERALGSGHEVLSLGISGYCTYSEVHLLETRGLAFSPDLVLLVFVANDFDDFNTQIVEVGERAPRSALVRGLFHRSHGLRALAVRAGWFGQDAPDRNRSAIGDGNVVRGLARLRALADQHGFDVALVVWPRFGTTDIEDPHPMPDDTGDLVVERIAAAHGIPAVRLSPFFRSYLAANPGNGAARDVLTHRRDDTHPSALGAEIAAQAFRSFVLEGFPVRQVARDEASLEAAIALASSSGARESERFKPIANSARMLALRGRHAEAIPHYERALAANPPTGWAAALEVDLGHAFASLGDFEQARAHYERAQSLQPTWSVPRRAIAALEEAR